jgi:hypothetical protein
MSLNPSYNALGDGRPVFYRDISQSPGNETGSGASYHTPVMDAEVHQLILVVNTYQRLLFRYASRIIKNKLVASLVVEDVIETYSHNIAFIPFSETRIFLKTCTYEKCSEWLLAKPNMLHLRKPKNPT